MPFKEILKDLAVRAHANGAVMLDWEGEAVDLYSTADDHDLGAIGAHKGIILKLVKDMVERVKDSDALSTIGISTAASKLAIVPLKEGYYLILTVDKKQPLGRVFYECNRAMKRIEKEMGL